MDNDSYSAPRAYSSNMEHTRALGSRRVPTHGHTHIYVPTLPPTSLSVDEDDHRLADDGDDNDAGSESYAGEIGAGIGP